MWFKSTQRMWRSTVSWLVRIYPQNESDNLYMGYFENVLQVKEAGINGRDIFFAQRGF